MKLFCVLPLVAFVMLGSRGPGWGADDKLLKGESLGKLKLDQTADQGTAIVGKPESKGKDAEWAATGKVTKTDIPANFPTPDKVSLRP